MPANKLVDNPDHDLDLATWLSQPEEVVDRVTVTSGTLKVAALTEDAFEKAQQGARKPDPSKGRGAMRFDSVLFKQVVVAQSLAKANGVTEAEVLGQLKNKLAGDVVTIFEKVAEISGFQTDKDKQRDAEDFFA